MSNSEVIKTIFNDPSDIEMDDLIKPKCTLQLKQSLRSLKSTWSIFWYDQSPIMAPPVFLQPTLNDIPITPIIPTDPFFPPCQQPKRPFHFGDDIMVVGRGIWPVRVEARDCNYYWIICWVENSGVKFTTQVDQCLVIDWLYIQSLSWPGLSTPWMCLVLSFLWQDRLHP